MGLTAILLDVWRGWWWAIVILAICAKLAYNYSKLSFIPGPFFAGLTDIWRYFHGKAGKCATDYELHRKYNSKLLRIGPNQISVSDPREIHNIYGLNPIFNKVCFRDAMDRNGNWTRATALTKESGSGLRDPCISKHDRPGYAQPFIHSR
jgi:hypothetical protein